MPYSYASVDAQLFDFVSPPSTACGVLLLANFVFCQVPFDIFDRKYKDSWYTVMQHFRQQVEEIEDMTKSFIEQSFQKLRSAEGAFELVQNFQNIQSRESINQSIDERYKDILSQYTKELDHIGAIFHAHKAAPPIYKNYPPVAGAIAWARDLYNRAKKPILRFKVRWLGRTCPSTGKYDNAIGKISCIVYYSAYCLCSCPCKKQTRLPNCFTAQGKQGTLETMIRPRHNRFRVPAYSEMLCSQPHRPPCVLSIR